MSDTDKQTLIDLYEILIVKNLKEILQIFQMLEYLRRYLHLKFAKSLLCSTSNCQEMSWALVIVAPP